MQHFDDYTRPWTEYPLVVVDFETTGVDPVTCEPVEVAAARFERGQLVDSFVSLLQPTMPIPPEATAIHGITDEMVDSAPRLVEVAGRLLALGQGAIPCAYNEPFDRRILHRYVTGVDCPMFDADHPWFDVLVVVASPKVDKWVKGPGRLRLGPTCLRHGVELDGSHRALSDACATGRLLYRLHEKGLVREAPLDKMLFWMAKRRAQQDEDHAFFRARMDYIYARAADREAGLCK